MQERKKQKKSAAAEAATRAAEPPYNLAQARETLRGYLGAASREDPGEARRRVDASVDELLEEGVVQSAETVFEQLLFLNPALDHETALGYAPLYEHVNRLRRLQDARLRHAMATLLQSQNP
jgi:hypothetical protein